MEFVSNLSVICSNRASSFYGTYMYLCINYASSLYGTYMYLCINHASSFHGTYMYNLGSRVQYEDNHGSSQASSSFPCPATVHGPMSQYYTATDNVDVS